MDEDLKKAIRALGLFSTIGISMVLSIAIGVLIGYYIDKWRGTDPWFMLVGLGFGIAAAFRNLFILYKKADKL